MSWLGIDIGTSFIKGAVLAAASEGERAAIGELRRRPFPTPLRGLPPGHVEVDPETVVAAVKSVLDELLPLAPDAKGLLLCGQMGGVVLVGEDGQARSNYLSWRDQRTLAEQVGGEPCLDQVRHRLGPEGARRLGHELKPGAAPCLLAWLAAHGQLPAHVRTLSLPAFVASRLTGAEPVEEWTMSIGALDVFERDWAHEALAQLGIEQIGWPRLVDATSHLGVCRRGTRELTCYPAVGDQQCALLGAGLRERELSLNISTGSQASLITEHPYGGAGEAEHQVRPYFRGRWLSTLTHLPAGRALEALVDLLTELPRHRGVAVPDAWRALAELTESAEAAIEDTSPTDLRLQVDPAFFAGPMGDRGSISGIRLENLSAGRVALAALERMAENYRVAATRLSPTHAWDRIIVSGGLAQNFPTLGRLLSRIFERCGELRICEPGEDTLAGLARIAGWIAAT